MNDSNLPTSAKSKIAAIVFAAILTIAGVSYFVFEVPAWFAILGAIGAIFLNGVALMFGRKQK